MAFERLYQLSPVLGSAQDSISEQLWSHGLFLVSVDDKPKTTPPTKGPGEKSPDYYANVGDAIRTLREDIPRLFEQDLNCECRQQQGWKQGHLHHKMLVSSHASHATRRGNSNSQAGCCRYSCACMQMVPKLLSMFIIPADPDAITTNQPMLPLLLHVLLLQMTSIVMTSPSGTLATASPA